MAADEKDSSVGKDIKRLAIESLMRCLKSWPHSNSSENELDCPMTFDGYACWNRTGAGTTVSQPCPSFVTGFDSRRAAYKRCTENGTWFRHPESGLEWSNYTTCVDVEDLEFRLIVNNLYVTGYSISLATLIISLTIFLTIRSLRCTRIRIHIQLFLSLALADSLWLVWYRHVVDEPLIVRSNPPWCVCLHLALHYFMIANYFWMFCEGLHLHLALVVVFVHDKVAMRWFLALGWGGPALLIGIYGTTRLLHGDDSRSCWMDDSLTMWILTVPVLISLVASMVFLGNVVRVLLTKLHSGSAHPVPQSLRKGVRATLILVPLFGLQHILLPFRPDAGTTGEKVYQIMSVLFVSLQGICVSCLFCFANQDVLIAMRSVVANLCPYARYGGRSDSINMAPGMTTQSRDANA